MAIYHRGSNAAISNTEIEYAIKWYLKRLVGPHMVAKLHILARHMDFPLKRTKAELIGYFVDEKSPRKFDMNLSSKLKRTGLLRGIAHECVHIKQYVKNQIWDYEEPLNAQHVRWKMRTIRSKDYKYRELPWEREAFRMERNLYIAYKRHLEKEGITF